MPMRKPAFAALATLWLASCDSPERAVAENETVGAEANAADNAGAPAQVEPGPAFNAAVDPVPPPDAVSHPGGYLPPVPGEANSTANASAPDPSGPATEDEYMRNKAGR